MDQRQMLHGLLGSFLQTLMQGQQQLPQQQNGPVIRELAGTNVDCQTQPVVELHDAETQTNPFVDYERPLAFDVATQCEDMSSVSVSTLSTTRRSLPSSSTRPSTSGNSVYREFQSSSGLLPWERDVPQSVSQRSMSTARDTEPVRERQRPPTPTARDQPPRKRGRPRKVSTGLKCRLCEEPKADKIVTPCAHFFCSKCIADWLEQWTHCPKCGQCPVDVKDADI